MSHTIVKFDISASAPSIVGGAGTSIKRFSDRTNLSDLLLPFGSTIDGQTFEVYASGFISTPAGRVTYVVQANTNPSLTEAGVYVDLARGSNIPGASDVPFHIALVLMGHSATGKVQGWVESMMLGGVSFPKKATTPLQINFIRTDTHIAPFSLAMGVIFEESAEENRAALTEFRAVQK